MVSVLVWQLLVDVTFFLEEERKAERFYPHRNHLLGDFFVWIGNNMKKEFRVLKNYEFSSIIQNRQFVKSSSFVCYFQKRKLDHARVGISVGKKLGNAVCRNKVKRQLRSIVDDVFTFEEGYDVIIIVRPAYTNKSFEENKNEMKENQNRINKRFLKK